MSTTKPPNMNSKLLLEVGEPTPLYVSFDRSTIDQKKHSYMPVKKAACTDNQLN